MKKIYMILAAITLLSMSLNAQTTYVKVTSADQIVVGNKYILVSEDANVALSATATGNFLSAVSVTISDNSVSVSDNDGVAVFTLGGSTNNYTLENNGSYLTGANGTSLTMGSSSTGTYSVWRLNNYNSTLSGYRVQNGGATGRAVRYSSTNNRFGNYSTSDANSTYAWLYVESSGTTPVTNPTLTVSTASLSIADGATTATFTVSGTNLTEAVAVSATNGFTVSPTSISAANAMVGNVSVTVTAPSGATSQSTGIITVTSGTASQTVNVTYTPTGGSTPSGNELTVPEDATTYTGVLPVYGLWYDSSTGQHNQMIYPSTMLTDMVGKTITSMTFYTRGDLKFYDGNVQLSLGTTSSTTFSSAAALTDNVTVSGSVVPAAATGDSELTIQLTTPYVYNGGNLLVDIVTQTGEYGSTDFYAKNMNENVGFYSYNGYSGQQSDVSTYLPKVTFTLEDNTPPTPTPELTAPENGSTVNVGTNEGSGVSTTITVSGNDLTENLTVSVSGTGFSVTPATISAADANAGTATVTVTYTGTDSNATGTLTISSGEVSATVNLTASYVQVNPTIAISPATQTINDANAGALTVTGTDITGNINVSAANDWSLTPTTLSNTGGQVSVSYTGRALSASTTVTASATGATDATATVNYVADLYIVTDNGVTGQWDFTNGTHMTYDPNTGTYTATFTANADNTFILFARMLGNDVNWNTRYVFGPDSNGDWWLPADGNGGGNLDLNDDDPIKIQYGGTYTITINSDGTFTITTGSTPQVPVLITPEDGSTVFVGTTSAELPTVSKEIPISGQYLTRDLTATISGEGFSFLTRDVTVPYADVNAATASVTVVYSGTNENATGTLTLSSDEVSATVNLTASYRKPEVLTDVPAGYVVMARMSPNGISTAVIELPIDLYHGEVVSVTYVNSLGMTSDTPFEGVNIVVTRYSDGTTSTSKVVK